MIFLCIHNFLAHLNIFRRNNFEVMSQPYLVSLVASLCKTLTSVITPELFKILKYHGIYAARVNTCKKTMLITMALVSVEFSPFFE